VTAGHRRGAACALLIATALWSPSPAASAEPLPLEDVLRSIAQHPKRIAAERAAAVAAGRRTTAEGAFDPTLVAFVDARPVGYYDQIAGGAAMSWDSPLWGLSLEGGWRIGQGNFATYEGKAETLDAGEWFIKGKLPLLYGGPLDAERAERLVSREAVVAAEASLAETTLDLAAAAEAAYWGWAAEAQARVVAQELLDLAVSREAGLLRQIEQGAKAPIEGLEVRRSVLSRRGKLADAEAKERSAAYSLSLYLRDPDGRPVIASAEQAPSLPDPAPELRPSVAEAAVQAWEARPEGTRWRADLQAAQVGQRLARANLLPKLDLSVGASADVTAQANPSASLAQPTVSLGLDLSWPTAARAARGKVVQATGKLEETAAKARFAQESLATEVAKLAALLGAAERRLALASDTVAVTADLARAEQVRFELGDSDLLIVNLREQTAAGAREEQARLRAQVLALRAAWRALVTPSS
jgi:cobalt-zinc-cadmium efflux system outer membrane protein